MSLRNFRAQGMAIEGMEELVQTLNDFMPREARNLARSVVHASAGKVRNRMRQRAPKDTGTLRKAITTKRGRGTPTRVFSDVLITKGKGQTNDAWYWHFVEFGTKGYSAGETRRDAGGKSRGVMRRNVPARSAQPFITPSVEEMRPELPRIFREEWGKKLEKAIARKARKK